MSNLYWHRFIALMLTLMAIGGLSRFVLVLWLGPSQDDVIVPVLLTFVAGPLAIWKWRNPPPVFGDPDFDLADDVAKVQRRLLMFVLFGVISLIASAAIATWRSHS